MATGKPKGRQTPSDFRNKFQSGSDRLTENGNLSGSTSEMRKSMGSQDFRWDTSLRSTTPVANGGVSTRKTSETRKSNPNLKQDTPSARRSIDSRNKPSRKDSSTSSQGSPMDNKTSTFKRTKSERSIPMFPTKSSQKRSSPILSPVDGAKNVTFQNVPDKHGNAQISKASSEKNLSKTNSMESLPRKPYGSRRESTGQMSKLGPEKRPLRRAESAANFKKSDLPDANEIENQSSSLKRSVSFDSDITEKVYQFASRISNQSRKRNTISEVPGENSASTPPSGRFKRSRSSQELFGSGPSRASISSSTRGPPSTTVLDLEQAIATYRVPEEEENRLTKSETEIQSDKAWQDAERVWLIHKGGFASASQLKPDKTLPEGRIQIRLDHGGEILEVDEDDVEKANPPQLDRAEDLALLRYLNESSCLHTVRQRYGGNLIHTYAGPSLIVVNPMQPMQIYSDKVIQMFKGCKQEDMPPHIFAAGQIAYREMLNTRSDQSVIFMGRSGSGKTTNLHHLLHYLTVAAGSVSSVLTVDKLNAMLTLLEAFGNSRTILNTNASRFVSMTTLDFDHSGQITSASVQVLMFEKTRVVRRPEGEPSFHVFYQMLAGIDSQLRTELQLNSLNEPNLFMTPLQKAEDRQRAVQFWAKIHNAMQMIGMIDEEIRAICTVLAAIYHLGVAGAAKGTNNKAQFSRPAAAQKAATLLGIPVEELARTIFTSSGASSLTRSTSMRGSPADKHADAHTSAIEALEGFVVGLYSDVFNAMVSMINRSLSSNYRSAASVTVVDAPGFQNPNTCGRQSGASFEDLCHNYMQEKLQLLYHDLTFTMQQDRYSQENVECDFEFVTSSPAAMVSLIEKPSQQTLRYRWSSYIEQKEHLKQQQGRSSRVNIECSHTKRKRSQDSDSGQSEESVANQKSARGQVSPGHQTSPKSPYSPSSGIPVFQFHLHHQKSHSHSKGEGQGQEQNQSSQGNTKRKLPWLPFSHGLTHHQHATSHVTSSNQVPSANQNATSDQVSTAGTSNSDSDDQSKEVRTSNPEAKDAEKKGLLWILDEEAIFPGATEDSFMDRFFTHHGEQKVRRDSLLRKASSLGNTFILNHFQGTNPVQYNASGWLKVCRENPMGKVATQVLQESKKSNLKELFNSVKAPVGGMVSGSIVGMEGSSTLRRVGSMRRTFMSGTAGLKKRSMCLQVKFQVDSIIENVRKTKVHFVHCVLPQHNAGLSELRSPSDKSVSQDDILMNVPLIRAQFRGSEILEAVRIHRQGFPDHMGFVEFRSRFEALISPSSKPSKDGDEKQAVSQILENLDIDKLNYRIGLSRVFFRAGALSRLEATRDDKLTGSIRTFQAYCRGYLARKNVAKLRVKHLAISCIQRNVRKFTQIRDWPWWKLYIKIKPVLNVHRTEEELREKELELEQMKSKVEKLEKERNDYKHQCDRLEGRLSEVSADLAEENTTASQATEILEQETAERMRLEKELKDVQGKYNALRRNHEKLEMEMMQVKLWQAETIDGELDEDEVDGGIYKERYERLLRELEFTKKRLNQQHQEELEQEQASKKVLEKRLHDAIEDTEEQRHQVQVAKKKSTKLATEMQDLKLHLEEQTSRNNDLERKQRKFDSELSKVQEEVRSERLLREKLQREKDDLISEKFTLDQQSQKYKIEAESLADKVHRMDRELSDMAVSGTKDTHEVVSLKRTINELESKLKDQEEELDDQAGTIQQLEQTKLRLEMNYEKSRQSHMKDLEEKDDEMEEMRISTQKKLKQMESQLEEEYEERKSLAQKNRELEKQLQELDSRASYRDKDTEKRLRKDLKKTKALLKDAEVVLQKQRSGEGTKATIKQLRNRLDDVEFSSSAAQKAKKTMELELQDLQQQLDELFKVKQDGDNKSMALLREKTDLQNQLEENEEEMAELMKKYKAVVQQQSLDQIKLNDQLSEIDDLVTERDRLKHELSEVKTRVQHFEESSVDKSQLTRLENKIKDLEARLDLEIASKHRQEVQFNRVKEQVERITEEKDHINAAKAQAEESIKRVQRQLRDLREEFSDVQKKEMEMTSKNKEMEYKISEIETDYVQNQSDLKLAFKRIADLQAALEEDMDSDSFLSEESDDELNGEDSDIDTFLANHKQSPIMRHRNLSGGTRSRSHSGASSSHEVPASPR